MMSIPTPIKRQNLAEEVVNLLKQKISSGEYMEGQKLPSEPELMQLFGVGRSTIREAVRILANTGMVRVQQGAGTFVESHPVIAEPLSKRLQRENGNDLNEVRQLLELKIAEKAALFRSDKDIEKMKFFLDQRKEAAFANNTERCIETDINFHISIAEASQNDILADLYKTFTTEMKKSFQESYVNTESFLETQSMHEALLQSIIGKDSQKAWYWAAYITNQCK
ncbi:FadR/GntR family transcriptional regulator [Sporocytophaga myxococcoides]|uniref:FadR/GntR family transcriptional regulator n=1 Tax=Sporocytophaga myxococcoides TaxID=153721 RepID=UPI0004245987|nr:FadR/GntR family transcriptional regulator [Sporocytophaga myxococcoides]